MEKKKRKERLIITEKLRAEEQEKDRINTKLLHGVTLTEDEQNFLQEL